MVSLQFKNCIQQVIVCGFFLMLSNSITAQNKIKDLLAEHFTVAILPAFYLDNVRADYLESKAQRLKFIKEFKAQLGVDVQYKFYIPIMLHQKDYRTFFRGADTLNRILDSNKISFKSPRSIDFNKVAEVLGVDAVIVLEVSEENVYKTGDMLNLFLIATMPSGPTVFDRVSDIYTFSNIFTNQALSLSLTVSIYDCKTGILSWSSHISMINKDYHSAIREMCEKALLKIPYRKIKPKKRASRDWMNN